MPPAVATLSPAPRLAPFAPGLPILGSAVPLARDTLDFLTATYRKMGPIFRVRVPGRSFTVLAGPEANQFLARDSNDCVRSRETWQPFVENYGAARNVIALDGELHARLRKEMKRTHGRSMAAPHLDLLAGVAREAALRLPVGRALRVVDVLRPIVSEQLGRLLAGRSAAEYTDDLIRVNVALTNVYVSQALPAIVLRLPGFRRSHARIMELGDAVLHQHRGRTGPPELPDLIDDLLAAAAADPTLLSEGDLRLAAIGPFLAGLDTVANHSSFLLYEILSRPPLARRIVDEVDACFDAGPLTLESLKSLGTLIAAAMETLRLHPVAPAIMRNAARPFSFANYDIPEGERLLVATSVAHFLASLWKRPEEFDPSRFAPDRAEHRQPGAYAPYGLGPHTCLGAGLAEVQVTLLVATLLRTVELQLDPEGYVLKKINAPGPTPDKRFRMRVLRARSQ